MAVGPVLNEMSNFSGPMMSVPRSMLASNPSTMVTSHSNAVYARLFSRVVPRNLKGRMTYLSDECLLFWMPLTVTGTARVRISRLE